MQIKSLKHGLLGAGMKENKYPQKRFLHFIFVKTFVGNCNFFPFRTQSTSISKVAESSDLSNLSDDENEESNDGELDHAIREVDKEENKMLFVYQNCKMRCLYRRYDRNLILLDATYKTTIHALPLYFTVVQTNVNYQVIVHFIFVIL